MSFDFLHGLATFGIIPFLIVLTIVVFFTSSAISSWPAGVGVKVLTFSIALARNCSGSTTVTTRAGSLRHSAWRLCQILRR